MSRPSLSALQRRLDVLEEAAGVHGPEPISEIQIEVVEPPWTVVETITVLIPKPENRSKERAKLSS